MLKSDFLEKGLGIVPTTHFVYVFSISSERKEILRSNKMLFSSFLKSIQLLKIVSDLSVRFQGNLEIHRGDPEEYLEPCQASKMERQRNVFGMETSS